MDCKDNTTTSETESARLGTDSHSALEDYSNKIIHQMTKKHWKVTYHIALNFWGSKFSQIATFENFVEIILWILLHTHAAHVICCGRGCTIALPSAWARSCQQSNAYSKSISLKRFPCGFNGLAPGHCLAWKVCVSHIKFLLKYFCKQWKISEIHEIKDPWKFCTRWYFFCWMCISTCHPHLLS